jgi:hypothetical protein
MLRGLFLFLFKEEEPAQYSPRYTSDSALVDIAVHHHGYMTF